MPPKRFVGFIPLFGGRLLEPAAFRRLLRMHTLHVVATPQELLAGWCVSRLDTCPDRTAECLVVAITNQIAAGAPWNGSSQRNSLPGAAGWARPRGPPFGRVTYGPRVGSRTAGGRHGGNGGTCSRTMPSAGRPQSKPKLEPKSITRPRQAGSVRQLSSNVASLLS